jgi:hypothetical protein
MRLRSGQWVILGMFGCALAAALFGMWFRYQSTRRSLEFWGAPAAVLIARAPQIEVLQFDPPLEAAGPLPVDTLRTQAADSEVVAASPGMANVRHAFIDDSSFDWDEPAAESPAWAYALVFSDGDRQAAILYDPAAGVLGSAATGGRVLLEPATRRGLAAYFKELMTGSTAQ